MDCFIASPQHRNNDKFIIFLQTRIYIHVFKVLTSTNLCMEVIFKNIVFGYYFAKNAGFDTSVFPQCSQNTIFREWRRIVISWCV